MRYELKPYPAYKDSGLPWLGDVPQHWGVLKTKFLFRYSKELNRGGLERNVLSLTLRGVVNNDPENPEGLVPKDYATYQIFEKDDLVFKLIDLENLRTSRVGLVHERGIMSSAYLRLKRKKANNVRFFFNQFFDLYLRGIYNQLGAGVRSTLGPNDLLNLAILVPRCCEQATIVRFLDHVDRRIRRYIRAKRRLIALLKEQKQAIIHRAVTRGLDPDVRFRPSGVEWLGEVPEHWQVTRLKFVATRIVDCLHATPQYSDAGEFPAIRTADISPGQVRLNAARRIERSEYHRWTQRLEPAEDDILYSREGERFGIAACVPGGVRLCISQRMMVFRIDRRHHPSFVMWLLNSPQIYAQANQDVMGATAPHVNISTIRNYVFAVPGRSEQNEIVEHIQGTTGAVEPTIAAVHRDIDLVSEYRTRLIADVVTGKLDVREAAARLPAEPQESDEPDILEELEEPNGAGEDQDGAVGEEA